MPGKLNIYNLGTLGVNVDKNPVQLEDGELTQAQNAISNDDGSIGSLRKRPGLIKVNSTAGAGAIKGAIGVPIGVGTAGNESPAVAPDTRSYFVGRRITATTAGWNTSTDAWATSPTTGGPDGYDANATPRVPDYLWPGMLHSGDTLGRTRALFSGRPGVMFENRFYYAGNDYTYQTTNPTIRMWDGTQDYLMTRVPSRSTTVAEAIIDMIVGGDNVIYLTVFDAGVYSANTMKVRVFSMDPDTGVLSRLGSVFPISPETVRVPFSLAWHAGRLWTKTHGAGITATGQIVYHIRPGIDTDWSSETGDGTYNSNLQYSFQGQLYLFNFTTNGVAANVSVRSTQAAYTTSHTVSAVQAGVTTMTGFGDANGFGAAATFGGNLYASYWNETDAFGNAGTRYARIYKFDGTTWSAVFGPAGNDASCVPYNSALVVDGRLYFISSGAWDSSNGVNRLLYTTDGSSFTAVTATLLNNDSTGIMGAIAS